MREAAIASGFLTAEQFDQAYMGYPDGSYIFSENRAGRAADYDPRKRAWYKGALATGGRSMTEPFIGATTQKLIITFSQLVGTPSQMQAVVARKGGTVVFGVVDVMQEIVDSVQSVAAIMSEISQATQSQSQGIAQINQAVVDMEGSTQQNTALVEEAAAAAASLREQARLLAQMVSGFQLQQTTETQGLRQIGPA